MTDFDWEKAAGREHDRMVDELNDLREAKARVVAGNGRLRRALEKINTITENIPEVSGDDRLTMRHDEALTEICILTRNTLAGERSVAVSVDPQYAKSLEDDAIREAYEEGE